MNNAREKVLNGHNITNDSFIEGFRAARMGSMLFFWMTNPIGLCNEH